MSYPHPENKGRYVSVIWSLFNGGAAIGSLIVFAQSINSDAKGISNGSYVLFICLMAAGAVLALFICNKDNVRRNDGSHIITPVTNITWRNGIQNILQRLRTDPYIVLFFPLFFASNWYYPYQFNDMNLTTFNVRTRALNNTLYWAAEIPGSFLIGYILDIPQFSRVVRARLGLVLITAMTLGVWGGAYAWQKGYTREQVEAESFKLVDMTDSNYGGPAVILVCYGLLDSILQSFILWTLGVLSRDSNCAADFTGFYKGFQSAGSAIAFRVNVNKHPFMMDLFIAWGLLIGSLVVAAPTIEYRIRKVDKVVEEVEGVEETE